DEEHHGREGPCSRPRRREHVEQAARAGRIGHVQPRLRPARARGPRCAAPGGDLARRIGHASTVVVLGFEPGGVVWAGHGVGPAGVPVRAVNARCAVPATRGRRAPS
ncbi:MAG: hypothetical protein ACK56I_34625, partial [bacterium]